MERDPKIVAEQEFGKSLYHKLRVDFKEDLQQGKIVSEDLEDLPEETLTNYKLGIAFEALKEKDYKAATAFFKQLGQGYSNLTNYAAIQWLKDRSQESVEQQKSLVEKISKVENCRARFSYAQERVNELAEKHDLIQKVRDGETTLEKTVKSYEEELNSMCKLKKKEFKQQIGVYSTKLVSLEQALQEFLNLDKQDIEALKDYKGSKVGEIGSALDKTSPVTSVAGCILTLSGVFTLNPAIMMAGVGMMCGSIGQFLGGVLVAYKFGKEDQKYKVRRMFSKLKTVCKGVDEVMHKTFITDLYLKDSEVFKNTFRKMSEEEQRYVLSQLLKKKEKNSEVDSWLSETCPKMIEEEGWFNIATGN